MALVYMLVRTIHSARAFGAVAADMYMLTIVCRSVDMCAIEYYSDHACVRAHARTCTCTTVLIIICYIASYSIAFEISQSIACNLISMYARVDRSYTKQLQVTSV